MKYLWVLRVMQCRGMILIVSLPYTIVYQCRYQLSDEKTYVGQTGR